MTHHPGAGLARLLASRGVFTNPQWHRAILAVDRAGFLPDTIYGPDPDHPGWVCPVTRADPRWERWVSEDFSLVTQVDDGRPVGGPNGEPGWGRLPTSSVSQPSLVVEMLQALDVRPGNWVLEIGTGTGYNTALLCHALGGRTVVSVEIDPGLAETAVKNLAAAGFRPQVIGGVDGAGQLERHVDKPGHFMGDHDGGMFHRVLATVAARGQVPVQWVRQVREGGIIVTPFEVGNTPGVLLRLRVGEDGTASGPIIGDAPFMLLRSQRPDPRRMGELVNEDDPATETGFVMMSPRLVAYRHQGWQLVLGHLVPDLRYSVSEAAVDRPEWAGEATVYVATPDGAWAMSEYTPTNGPYEAKWAGGRNLWREIGAAWQVWVDAGRPGRDRLGVTVSEGGTRMWVDHPEGLLGPLV